MSLFSPFFFLKVYWKLSEDGRVPDTWPKSLETKINVDNPMDLTLNEDNYRAFFAVGKNLRTHVFNLKNCYTETG